LTREDYLMDIVIMEGPSPEGKTFKNIKRIVFLCKHPQSTDWFWFQEEIISLK
jgi:hypothetical protein